MTAQGRAVSCDLQAVELLVCQAPAWCGSASALGNGVGRSKTGKVLLGTTLEARPTAPPVLHMPTAAGGPGGSLLERRGQAAARC